MLCYRHYGLRYQPTRRQHTVALRSRKLSRSGYFKMLCSYLCITAFEKSVYFIRNHLPSSKHTSECILPYETKFPSVRFSIARILMNFTPYSLYEGGDFGVKIKVCFLIFRGLFGAAKFLTHMLSLILRRIFFEFGQKKCFFFAKPLRPFVSVYRDFLINFDCLGTLKIIRNIEFLRGMLRTLCARWAYGSGTDAHPEHARQELMRTLSIRISSLRAFSGCASVFLNFKCSFCIPSACA